MKKLLVGLSILAVANISTAASKPKVERITPEKIQQEINVSGAQQTVARLTATPGARDWSEVRKRIQTGNSDWLMIAGALSKGVNDVQTGQELRFSLSLALTKNPTGVLRLINLDPINVNYLCSAPFSHRGFSFLNTYTGNTIRALNKVKEPGLQQSAQECIAKLQQTLAVEKALRPKRPPKEKSAESDATSESSPGSVPASPPANPVNPAPSSEKK